MLSPSPRENGKKCICRPYSRGITVVNYYRVINNYHPLLCTLLKVTQPLVFRYSFNLPMQLQGQCRFNTNSTKGSTPIQQRFNTHSPLEATHTFTQWLRESCLARLLIVGLLISLANIVQWRSVGGGDLPVCNWTKGGPLPFYKNRRFLFKKI